MKVVAAVQHPRVGGRRQVTYDGHPLYTYSADSRGRPLVGASAFGGSWYAVTRLDAPSSSVPRSADACSVSVSFAREPKADPLWAGADRAAEAALRELPEALVIVFDAELRFVLAAGQALERVGRRQPAERGQRRARTRCRRSCGAAIEPLLRSALEGDTRSREIWTADHRHCLMVDVGPAAPRRGDGRAARAGRCGRRAGHHRPQAGRAARGRAPAAASRRSSSRRRSATGLLDTEGRWLLVNRALCDMTGYTADELIGKRFEGIVHPEDAEIDLERAPGAARRREIRAFRIEKRCLDASGETVSVILSMSRRPRGRRLAAALHRPAAGRLRAQAP